MDLTFNHIESGAIIDLLQLETYRYRVIWVETPENFQRQGIAGSLMTQVCQQADAEQIDLELYVSPLTGPGLNERGLLRFYSKYGFRWIADADDGSPIMERKTKVADGNVAKNLISVLTKNGWRLIHILFKYDAGMWVIEYDRDGENRSQGDRNWARAVAKVIQDVNS